MTGKHPNPPGDLQISVVSTSDLDDATRNEIITLCNSAFQEEEFEKLFDLVASAVNPMHILARLDGRLVSHAMWSTRRLFLDDGTALKTAYVDAVATDPHWQGRGIGSAVIGRLTGEIGGYDVGCLSTNRISFYARNGWKLWTGQKGVMTSSGVHFTSDVNVMIWRTQHTPRLDGETFLAIEPRRGDQW